MRGRKRGGRARNIRVTGWSGRSSEKMHLGKWKGRILVKKWKLT